MRSSFVAGFNAECRRAGIDPDFLWKFAASAAAATPAVASKPAASSSSAPSAPKPAAPKLAAPSDPFRLDDFRMGLGRRTAAPAAPVVSKAPKSPQTVAPKPVAAPVVKTQPAAKKDEGWVGDKKWIDQPNVVNRDAMRTNIRSNIEAYRRLTANPYGTANPFELHQAYMTGTGPYAGWAETARERAVEAAQRVVQAPAQQAPAQQSAPQPVAKPVARPYIWRNANGRNFRDMDEAKFLSEWRKGTRQQRSDAMKGIGVTPQMFRAADAKQQMLWRRQAADSFYANRVRQQAARNANFGVDPSRRPSQNFYRPVSPGSNTYVNAYGDVIDGSGRRAGSLLGNSPYAVAGWDGRGNMELNGLHYVGQRNFAPGTRVLRRPTYGVA